MYIGNLNDLAEFSDKSHTKKDILKTGGFNSVLVCMEDGQEIPPHPEPYYVLFIVYEGKGVITHGGEKSDVGPGSMVFAGSGEIRGIRCRERMKIVGIQEAH
ncbi:MAG: Cupin domain protein [Methanocella sp. PtaU1.Bin125]|nr:MAG: Cupin domain protein [Methanocella sp. PtaU1.Bin125]